MSVLPHRTGKAGETLNITAPISLREVSAV